jgi:hypothetical protein
MSLPNQFIRSFTMHSRLKPLSAPMKNAASQRVRRKVLAAALLAASLGVSVTAHDATPENPPELKDFRLDTPPPREKAPEAAPPPIVAPEPQPKAERPRAEPTTPRPAPKTAPSREAEAQPSPVQPESQAQPSAVEPGILPESLPQAEAPTESEPAATPSETGSLASTLLDLWPILAALIALLAGWLAFRWFRNRQPDALEGIAQSSEPPITPTVPPPGPEPTTPQPAVSRGSLSASFEPSDARLSIANLTITGCLRLRYDGPEALQSLRLRNLVISASEGQRSFIDSFHNDLNAGQIDTLGGVQPGEEIVLTLELQVPRDGLQAFDWRERRFVAPILLLNLSSDDPSIAPCRINCLVGQEGDPMSPRMQPLPIDRGPRHFAALRFSPIAA